MKNGRRVSEQSADGDARVDPLAPLSLSRRAYEPPRIERRIPVASNTMQPISGGEDVLGPEE